MKKNFWKKMASLMLALALVLSMGGISLAEENNKVVNIAVTGTISSVNPLLIDATEVMKYALSLEFLPLVELNRELEFVPQLAQSITKFCASDFTAEFIIEALLTWTMAQKSFDEIYGIIEKLF